MIHAIQAASPSLQRIMPRAASPKPAQPPVVTPGFTGLRGEEQLVFAGRGVSPRLVGAMGLAALATALTVLSGNSTKPNNTLGNLPHTATEMNAPLPAVTPQNPTATAKAGLGRTVPVPLQVLEGQMVHYKMEGPKDDPEGFNTVGFKDKAGKSHWLVPDGFNGDMYGFIDYADFKQPGLKDGQRAVFVGLQSPEHEVKVNDQYVGHVFFVQRIQSPEGKVLWTNPEFQNWIDRIMSSPKLHAGLLKGEEGIQIPALLPNTPEPKNP